MYTWYIFKYSVHNRGTSTLAGSIFIRKFYCVLFVTDIGYNTDLCSPRVQFPFDRYPMQHAVQLYIFMMLVSPFWEQDFC